MAEAAKVTMDAPKSKLPKKMAVRDRPSKPAKEEEPGPIPEEDSWPELALPGSESGEESLGDSADEGEEEQDGDLGDADDDIPGPDGSGFVRPGRPLGRRTSWSTAHRTAGEQITCHDNGDGTNLYCGGTQ